MTRGILATCYADLNQDKPGNVSTTAEVRALYAEYYANEPFIHVVDQPPHTKWTYASNACFIYPMVDPRTRRLLVISCLDNLVKGAAGQAIGGFYISPETSTPFRGICKNPQSRFGIRVRAILQGVTGVVLLSLGIRLAFEQK